MTNFILQLLMLLPGNLEEICTQYYKHNEICSVFKSSHDHTRPLPVAKYCFELLQIKVQYKNSLVLLTSRSISMKMAYCHVYVIHWILSRRHLFEILEEYWSVHLKIFWKSWRNVSFSTKNIFGVQIFNYTIELPVQIYILMKTS